MNLREKEVLFCDAVAWLVMYKWWVFLCLPARPAAECSATLEDLQLMCDMQTTCMQHAQCIVMILS